jgi:hypothetical protein
MRSFSTAELAGMQATQETAMMDRCTILSFTAGAADERGLPTVTYVAAATNVPCGLQHSRQNDEAMGETGAGTQVPMFDGTLRLPISTVIKATDRVSITHRFGVALAAAELYELVGNPRRGPSGLLGRVKRVTVS